MRQELETTLQIPRDELLGLLNTMDAVEKQRITARFPAVVPDAVPDLIDEAVAHVAAVSTPAPIHAPALAELQLPVHVTPPGTGVSVGRTTLTMFRPRLPVIAISFAVTLALGLVALIVA